jgi:hypothetical protein
MPVLGRAVGRVVGTGLVCALMAAEAGLIKPAPTASVAQVAATAIILNSFMYVSL